MFKHSQTLTAALTLTLLLSVSTSFAKAPDFTVQVPYKGDGKPTAPQQDFYLYVNAGWQKTTKIPADSGSVSSFKDAGDRKDKQLEELTKLAVKHAAAGTATQDEKNIANLYACIKDQKSREQAGLGNLKPILESIEGIQSNQEYAEKIATLFKQHGGIPGMVGPYGGFNDLENNDKYVATLEGPAGLPREQLESKSNDEYFAKYRDHIRDVLHLYGRDEKAAAKTANDIFNLQKDLGLHSLTVAERSDPTKRFRTLDLAGLQKLYSHLNVEAMLNAGGIGPKDGIHSWLIQDPAQMARFNELNTPALLPTLKEYSIYSLLDSHSALLGRQYQKLAIEFGKVSEGSEKAPTQKKMDLDLTEGLLAPIYGRLYGKTYFSDASKKEVTGYVQLVLQHYRNELQQLDWLTPATKAMAIKKLDNMDINVGYPEAWPDYLDQLQVKSPKEGGVLINNTLDMVALINTWDRQRIGTPVRKDYWDEVLPQTINAFYTPTDNSINFSAAILQKPFFDPKADRETNLGGVGVVIGHEITHCFDNTGSKFDYLGRMRNWWQPADYEAFSKRQERISAYYSRFLLPDGTRVNGQQSLTENTADLGGMNTITQIIGHNPEALRRAYKNFAIIWRSKASDRYLQDELSDVHALPYVRVIGVLGSTDGFYEAYPVKPGDKMYVAPEDRVKLW